MTPREATMHPSTDESSFLFFVLLFSRKWVISECKLIQSSHLFSFGKMHFSVPLQNPNPIRCDTKKKNRMEPKIESIPFNIWMITTRPHDTNWIFDCIALQSDIGNDSKQHQSNFRMEQMMNVHISVNWMMIIIIYRWFRSIVSNDWTSNDHQSWKIWSNEYSVQSIISFNYNLRMSPGNFDSQYELNMIFEKLSKYVDCQLLVFQWWN